MKIKCTRCKEMTFKSVSKEKEGLCSRCYVGLLEIRLSNAVRDLDVEEKIREYNEARNKLIKEGN